MTAPVHHFPPPFSARTAWVIALTSLLLCLLFGVLVDAGQPARWHRYTQTRLDATTVIDVVKDVYSGQCFAVYRLTVYGPGVSAAPLGPVPCEAAR